MSTIEQIESAIIQLSPQDFTKLKEWLAQLDRQRWDEQIERDAAAGKLDLLTEEALAEFVSGKCRKL